MPTPAARIWKDHGPKPWKTDTFKVSTDPHFEEKLVDVVGLDMNPPERAVVFSFDEKTQVLALDRTQPSLPMKKGRGATMTHGYKRHGTTALFADLVRWFQLLRLKGPWKEARPKARRWENFHAPGRLV